MLVVSALTASAQKIDPQHYTFEQFITDFKRSYRPDSPEYALRQQIFEENLRGVRAHNAVVNQSWKLGINRFSDRTANESAAFLGYNRLAEYGYDRKALKKHQGPDLAMMPDAGPLPNAVDWSARPGTPLHTWSNAPSLMTGQKEQGSCGSCWALAVAANVESHTALKTGSLPVLSSQQLLSCSPNPHHCGGKGGCDGSTPMLAYEYAQENGLVTEESFTYTAIDCIDCDGANCDACNRCSSIGAHAVVSLHAPILTTSFHPTHPYPHNPCARASIMTPNPCTAGPLARLAPAERERPRRCDPCTGDGGPAGRGRGGGRMVYLQWWRLRGLHRPIGAHGQSCRPAGWLRHRPRARRLLEDPQLVGLRLGRGWLHALATECSDVQRGLHAEGGVRLR